MIFAGIQKTSTIDYPGRLCSILFTQGCMFRCHYCHNPELVLPDQYSNNHISDDDAIKFLINRKNLVDAISITGGEVTLHKGLYEFVRKLKDNGFKVKIDTNGVNPGAIEKLVSELDFIAMDVKAVNKEHYEETVDVSVNFDNIKKSIELIKNSGIDYEFRTTVVPALFPIEKFDALGKLLQGSKKLVLQQFVNRKVLNPEYAKKSPYTPQELTEIKQVLEKYIDVVDIRGI